MSHLLPFIDISRYESSHTSWYISKTNKWQLWFYSDWVLVYSHLCRNGFMIHYFSIFVNLFCCLSVVDKVLSTVPQHRIHPIPSRHLFSDHILLNLFLRNVLYICFLVRFLGPFYCLSFFEMCHMITSLLSSELFS